MKRLERWGDNIVGQKTPDYQLDLTMGGLAICRVECYKRSLVIEGVRPKVLGLGAIWTANKFRKQGNATALIERAHAFAKSFKLDGTVLFSLEPLIPFYEKRGYTLHAGPVTMFQEEYKVVPVPVEVFFLYRFETFVVTDEEGPIQIEGLPW